MDCTAGCGTRIKQAVPRVRGALEAERHTFGANSVAELLHEANTEYWHQHWHYRASIVTQTSVSAFPPAFPCCTVTCSPAHRHRHQLHCPEHKCTPGNAAILSCDVPKAVHELEHLYMASMMAVLRTAWTKCHACGAKSRPGQSAKDTSVDLAAPRSPSATGHTS